VLRDQLTPHRKRAIVLVGGAAGLLTVGIGASIGMSSATAEKYASNGPEPRSVIGALGPPTEVFPAGVDTEGLIAGGIDRSTLRKLGSDGPKSFWTGVDHAGDICLVTVLDVQVTTAAPCSAPKDVEANGLDLSAAGASTRLDDGPIVAVLLPDSVDAEPITAGKHPWTRYGDNLLVAKQSEIPEDVTYEFGRKRGHSGPKINYPG